MKTVALNNFETDRLEMHVASKDDAEFILELVNSPKWLQFIGQRNVHTIEDAEMYIEKRMVSQQKELGFSNYIMVIRSSKQKIGTIGLFNRPGLEGIDIGFALLSQYESQGFALEAANKLKHIAINELNLSFLNAITTYDNLSSQRLLEKLGFEASGNYKYGEEELMLFMYHTK
jgi:[ribosomal protein S5]-alanine N-acetyltransferase